jgi:hypothetical protein
VVIAGGGPTGLMLGGGLALAGVDVAEWAPAVCTRVPSRFSINAESKHTRLF